MNVSRSVIVRREVSSEFPGFGPLLPGTYAVDVNPHGAVSAIREDGSLFGLKPGEFEWESEPHPFSRAGWAGVLSRIPAYGRESGWTACRGSQKVARG